MDERFDEVVLGAGLRGLAAALRARRQAPAGTLLVVDAAAQPGGQVRTQRSNGFACELGPFAFDRPEVEPLLALLQHPPRLVGLLAGGQCGHTFDGAGLHEGPVAPHPVSFPGGNEDVVQACRRALGPVLRLGRQVVALRPGPVGWTLDLGGEVPTTIAATRLTLALPVAAAATLLGSLDPALPACAERLAVEPRAFAFLGGHAGDAPELRGYGVVPAAGLDTPVAEMIFCTQAFPGRALPGRFLVRCELAGPTLEQDDEALLAAAEGELRRWTGTRAPVGFRKVHRFLADVEDGARVECRVRLLGLAARATGLAIP
jgi:protoporphyrinogen oxidase